MLLLDILIRQQAQPDDVLMPIARHCALCFSLLKTAAIFGWSGGLALRLDGVAPASRSLSAVAALCRTSAREFDANPRRPMSSNCPYGPEQEEPALRGALVDGEIKLVSEHSVIAAP